MRFPLICAIGAASWFQEVIGRGCLFRYFGSFLDVSNLKLVFVEILPSGARFEATFAAGSGALRQFKPALLVFEVKSLQQTDI